MQLHPLAYAREAERLARLANLAALAMDYRGAARLERLAADMKRRAN